MIKGRVRSKFIIGFLLIFIISSSILNLFIRKSIYRNRDRNIKNEKTILLNSSREFIKGVLENEVGDVSEKALIKSSYNIALKLSVLNNSYVAIHDKSGKLIEESNTNIARRAIEEDEDVKNALNNKAYYVLKNYKEEKDKVTKLEKAKQEFYNNITHELKTPLTGISSYAQILEEGTDDVEFVKRAASRIKQESDRLHGLVVDLIEVSKGKSEIFEDKVDTNLKDIIEKVCIDLQKKQMDMKWSLILI
ncbi:histidine kinase dimerization/phospho-acceptor domain-containing protein [Inconstantimicrobium porci]|uniref:histidine kinase dimerization/phospho-acceptor domain-containing protein n=1 Tax=Inconstantimicrobium porci TaxID=2652291 RepID=UPI002409E0A4|nr:histidine kinase dimerization/phospho-acceptor domain-containing protein [Inconstantimicrobium porci]MDD6770191.1 histidine kinase dimerization/phospho-acceptor domain-containing protein [Inconstantimicrobium porci]